MLPNQNTPYAQATPVSQNSGLGSETRAQQATFVNGGSHINGTTPIAQAHATVITPTTYAHQNNHNSVPTAHAIPVFPTSNLQSPTGILSQTSVLQTQPIITSAIPNSSTNSQHHNAAFITSHGPTAAQIKIAQHQKSKQSNQLKQAVVLATCACCTITILAVLWLMTDIFYAFEPYGEIRTGDDYIGLVFSEKPSKDVRDAFVYAARRWSAAIATNSIQNIYLPSDDIECGGDMILPVSQLNFTVLDHLLIFVEITGIDGVGGILGRAGPCAFDPGSGMPAIGSMQFDSSDLDQLQRNGALNTVILHEMGHVLGIGTLWAYTRQDGEGGFVTNLGNQALLQDPIFNQNGNLNSPFNQPHFVGENAVSEYRSLGNAFVDSVPLEDGRDIGNGQSIDTAQGYGLGSVDGHWLWSEFVDELMVFQIDPSYQYSLSRVTLGSLEDIGYDVNYAIADSYSLPNSIGRRFGVRGQSLKNGATIDTPGEKIVLRDDTIVTRPEDIVFLSPVE